MRRLVDTRFGIPYLALAFVLTVSLAGCAAPAPPMPQIPGAGDGGGSVTEADDGETVELLVGETVSIRLKANPSTGYAWRLDGPLPAALATVTVKYVPEPASPGTVGSGGHTVAVYKAVKVGRGEIRLVYGRPWEEGRVPPSVRVTYRIFVR